jgi:hypothetical protein
MRTLRAYSRFQRRAGVDNKQLRASRIFLCYLLLSWCLLSYRSYAPASRACALCVMALRGSLRTGNSISACARLAAHHMDVLTPRIMCIIERAALDISLAQA